MSAVASTTSPASSFLKPHGHRCRIATTATTSLSSHWGNVSSKPLPLLRFSSALFCGPRRSSKSSPAKDRNLGHSVSIESLSGAAGRLLSSSEAKVRCFFSDGAEAYRDLRTSVRVDRGDRIVFSCRRSSVVFFASLLVWSLAAVLAARVLSWLWRRRLGFRLGWGAVVRRDRSLGGREVVVGTRGLQNRETVRRDFRGLANPLSPVSGEEMRIKAIGVGKSTRKQDKLPKWWPESIPSPVVSLGKEEFQKEANRLVRVIMDRRMSGMDYKEDDMIQLRQICRVSGVKVAFDTANARDSFYRASVDFIFTACSRSTHPNFTVHFGGEEVRQFISGFADNIGLDNVRAAKLVRGAIAARTRSWFLQSWAYEAQGKRSEAREELSKICKVHQIFPFEEFSPEMDMVASGLKRNLRIEQREHLCNLFGQVCGIENQRIAAEALGLMSTEGSGSNVVNI